VLWARAAPSNQAVAAVLDLVNPVRPEGGRRRGGWQAGLYRTQNRHRDIHRDFNSRRHDFPIAAIAAYVATSSARARDHESRRYLTSIQATS
jgi:hypothetical protein